MRTFSEFAYQRPDMANLQRQFRDSLAAFRQADSADGQLASLRDINRLRLSFMSMQALVEIRHTCNTADVFYEQENDFFDENSPLFEELEAEYYRALVAAPQRQALEAHYGRHLFDLAELRLKTFSPEIIDELQQENRLSSEFVKLKASARILFDGSERNLSELEPYTEAKDRAVRQQAVQAVSSFYEANQAQFDRIFDDLVKVRHRMARKLGFENFVQLAYARLSRSDYDANMVATYRQQIRTVIVPAAARLRQRQAERLGLDSLKFYDEGLNFLSGNALPKGKPADIIEAGRLMYHQMSPETGHFIDDMLGRGLLDLETRKDKAGGGYCTYIPDEKAPFIFSNFNGTSGDVDVLTHEAGHAFQVSRSLHFELPEYHWPTYEACEIHSMGMEFLAWPWMEKFFAADTAKYKFAHLSAGLLFIPYGACVDEFQHWVYEHPEADCAGRRARWRELERQYLPYRDYDGDSFLEQGGYWFRQGHIFEDPFYYIDYTLAQVCAYEFWVRAEQDRLAAWKTYLALCDLGGSRPFTGLLKAAGLANPFQSDTVERIIAPVLDWLEAVDDRRF